MGAQPGAGRHPGAARTRHRPGALRPPRTRFSHWTGQRAEEYPPDDFRHDDPRFQGENYDANVLAAQVVQDIAKSLDAKSAQIALAWLLHKGDDIVPIPGTKRRQYLEQNLAAAAVELSAEHMKTLDEALAPQKITGLRYNKERMSMIDR